MLLWIEFTCKVDAVNDPVQYNELTTLSAALESGFTPPGSTGLLDPTITLPGAGVTGLVPPGPSILDEAPPLHRFEQRVCLFHLD